MPMLQLRQPWSGLIQGLSPYNPFLASFFFLLFLHLFLKLTRGSNLTFPPSPPKLPIIGNLHQLARGLLHRRLLALSEKYGPLMLLHLGQIPTLVVSSAELVEEIVKNHDDVFSSRPRMTSTNILMYGCEDVAFAPYGQYWRKARKVCVHELLSNTRVQSFKFVREEEVDLLINLIRHASSNGSSIHLSKMLHATSHNTVSRCVMGKKAKKEHENFGELTERFVSLVADFSFGDLFPFMGWLDVLTGLVGRLKATFREMDAFLDSVIEEQKALANDTLEDCNQQYHFLQILLHLIQEEDIDKRHTQDNIKAILLVSSLHPSILAQRMHSSEHKLYLLIFQDMFLGAVQTTAIAVEWAMAELLKNPRIMKMAQEEVRRVAGGKGKMLEDDINQMENLKCIVKETLRLHPPASLLAPRETTSRIKLRGYDILPKTRVLFNVWAIQRSPELWDMPEVFLPERFENNPILFKGQDFKFIPFGMGKRSCIGMSFGVVMVELLLANLLYCFDWKLPDNVDSASLDLTEAFGITTHIKSPLQLVPIAYK